MKLAHLDLEQRVYRFIREKRLIRPGEKLVVAVSGGPDSVCLLRILINLRDALDISLHIAHLDHRLRGAASAADAAYVAALAQKFGIPVTVESRDVKAYRTRRSISLEEAAREVRYRFLAETAREISAARVAVGHTAADHVETILMHLIRGSGLNGMRGLLPLSTWRHGDDSVIIIRPLLCLTREETAAYCRRHRLQPRLDATNVSVAPFRNRVRHELLPLLRQYNPRVDEALQRLAGLAAADLDFIGGEVRKIWPALAHAGRGALTLEKDKLLVLPDALKRHILRQAMASALGSLKDIEAGHIEDMLEALDRPSGTAVGLPEGLIFTVEHDRYLLSRDAAATCPFPPLEKEYRLNIPGRTAIPGGEIVAATLASGEFNDGRGGADDFTAFFDLDVAGSDLAVRHRLAGDRFQPLGLPGLKKLNTFMIDARIPRAWRGRIPIVTAPGRIIWVAGWRIDERAKVTGGTTKVLRLDLKRG